MSLSRLIERLNEFLPTLPLKGGDRRSIASSWSKLARMRGDGLRKGVECRGGSELGREGGVKGPTPGCETNAVGADSVLILGLVLGESTGRIRGDGGIDNTAGGAEVRCSGGGCSCSSSCSCSCSV